MENHGSFTRHIKDLRPFHMKCGERCGDQVATLIFSAEMRQWDDLKVGINERIIWSSKPLILGHNSGIFHHHWRIIGGYYNQICSNICGGLYTYFHDLIHVEFGGWGLAGVPSKNGHSKRGWRGLLSECFNVFFKNYLHMAYEKRLTEHQSMGTLWLFHIAMENHHFQ